MSFLEILAPELNDHMLTDILDLENGGMINHIIWKKSGLPFKMVSGRATLQ